MWVDCCRSVAEIPCLTESPENQALRRAFCLLSAQEALPAGRVLFLSLTDVCLFPDSRIEKTVEETLEDYSEIVEELQQQNNTNSSQ